MGNADSATARDVDLATWLMLAAVALTGFAHLAFLPPFEGFDETAHFSYIQQIADEGHIPRPSSSKLSTDVEAYPGPFPYSPVAPFDQNNGLTYKAFFAGTPPGTFGPVIRLYAPG